MPLTAVSRGLFRELRNKKRSGFSLKLASSRSIRVSCNVLENCGTPTDGC